jgi:glutamyl-tRNA synthetase
LLSFLREAISGQRVTPPLFECMQVLGKERTIQRLKEALTLI